MGLLDGLFKKGQPSNRAQPRNSPSLLAPISTDKGYHQNFVISPNIFALSNSSQRDAGLERLEREPRNDVLLVLVEILNSPDDVKKRRGVSALGVLGRQLGWPETIDILRQCLNSKNRALCAAVPKELIWIRYNPHLTSRVNEFIQSNWQAIVRLITIADRDELSYIEDTLILGPPDAVSDLRSLMSSPLTPDQRNCASRVIEYLNIPMPTIVTDASTWIDKPAVGYGIRRGTPILVDEQPGT